jgi:hypothetical protein
VILGAREWKIELLAIWKKGFDFIGSVLLGMGTEGVGGGDFIGERYARVWSGGDGAGATRQRVRRRGGGLLPAMMAAVGALQRDVGRW